MAHSYAETVTLACPQCGRQFSADLWLIVDAGERPDLLERVREGALHTFTCPGCGQAVGADAPLLLYFPDAPLRLPDREARLLFSPARRTSTEEDREHARALLARLRDTLGPAWRDEWLADGLPGVPQEMLPLLLSGDPEAALRRAAEQAAAELERLRQEEPETYRQLEEAARQMMQALPLLEALQEFIEAETWPESRRVLEVHPELLSDEADALLERLIQAQEDEDRRRILEEHRALLRRCREVGIARALAEKMLPPEVLERATALGLTPEQALELAELAAAGVEIRSPEDLERLLEARPDLREKIEQATGLAGGQDVPPDFQNRIQELLSLQARAEQHPGLWPQVLEGWQALIARAGEAGLRDLGARARGQLANACIRLYEITGDARWAQQAEQLLGEVENVFSRSRDPLTWAAVQNSLGVLFLDRYERSGEEAHAQAAEEHFRNALEEYRRKVAPSDWAMTQHSLGNLFLDRYERSGEETHARAAEGHYRNALAEYRREVAPSHWATVQHSLGTLFLRRYERSGEEAHARAAEEHYRNALEEYRREVAPSRWAMTQHALGILFLRRYERSGGEAHARAAEEHYCKVLTLANEVALPRIYPFRAAQALSRLYFRQRKWKECLETASQAFSHLEELLTAGLTRTGRENWLREAQGLPAQAAGAALQTGDRRGAVLNLDRGRAYLLAQAMGLSSQDLERLPSLGFSDLYERFTRARQDVQRLASLLERREGEAPRLLEEAKAAQDALQAAMAAIRQVPGFEYFLRPLPFEKIQEQAKDAPLVYLAATESGGFALIVQARGVEVLELPGLTEEALQKQVLGFSEKEYRALQEQAYRENRRPPSQVELLGGYLGAYLPWRKDLYDEAARRRWFSALEETLRWLGEAVMGPVVAALETLVPPGRLVRLVPGGLLGLLPLHAALLPSGDGGPVYALDRFTFAYIPSAQALYHARRAARRPADSLLAVRYPDPRFRHADQAVDAALDLFPSQQRRALRGQEARREAVQAAFNDYGVLFFFTHGSANFSQPLQSGLLMVGDEWLTLGDIQALRSERARLAVLAACETGVPSDLRNIEEVISLPSGLMQAGVPGVVGPLWAVLEASTALLMTLFFEYWRTRGLEPPQALRRAQQTLRDGGRDPQARMFFREYLMPRDAAETFHVEMLLEDFAHPFYWAAFTYTGV